MGLRHQNRIGYRFKKETKAIIIECDTVCIFVSSQSLVCFATNPVAYFGLRDSGAIALRQPKRTQGQSMYLSWNIGKPTGKEKSVSEAKGQAILAVETLKKIFLDKTKFSVTAPEKVTNETGQRRCV